MPLYLGLKAVWYNLSNLFYDTGYILYNSCLEQI